MSKEFVNNKEMCIVCFKRPEKEFILIKHHIKYNPERIAFVHYKCHQEIHDGKHPHLIQYKRKDAIEFYKSKK
tara:strand:+ start:1051 stop:1269 length:219 start_codon:yes stop_codon:yes gene_type:complete